MSYLKVSSFTQALGMQSEQAVVQQAAYQLTRVPPPTVAPAQMKMLPSSVLIRASFSYMLVSASPSCKAGMQNVFSGYTKIVQHKGVPLQRHLS